MSILVTGFDPFGGEQRNPSWEVAQALPTTLAGLPVHRVQLPTVFGAAGRVLMETVHRCRPSLVLCLGQAGGRAALTVERVGINLRDARIPDNTGAQPVDQPVCPGGPAACFSTLPTRTMVEAIRGGGLPAALSYTAGTFVCNEVMYTLLEAAQRERLPLWGGFLHVPYLPAQTADKPGQPSMALTDMVRGVTLALEAAAIQRNEST